MKRMNKLVYRLLLLVMVMSFICCLSGCGKDSVSGVYTETGYGEIDGGYSFNDDGVVLKYETNWNKPDDRPMECFPEYTYGTYTVDDKAMVINISGEDEITAVIMSEDQIVIDGMEYKKRTEPYSTKGEGWAELNEQIGL